MQGLWHYMYCDALILSCSNAISATSSRWCIATIQLLTTQTWPLINLCAISLELIMHLIWTLPDIFKCTVWNKEIYWVVYSAVTEDSFTSLNISLNIFWLLVHQNCKYFWGQNFYSCNLLWKFLASNVGQVILFKIWCPVAQTLPRWVWRLTCGPHSIPSNLAARLWPKHYPEKLAAHLCTNNLWAVAFWQILNS